MTNTRIFILCACAAALIACSKDADDKASKEGGDTAAGKPAATKAWQLESFLVTVDLPDGWQFWEIDADFGKLTFANGDGDFADSTLTLNATCGGSCVFDKFPDNIKEAAESSFKSVPGATWEKQPTETKPGVWAYRFRGESMGKDTVKLFVSHIDERTEDHYLQCSAALVGDDVGKADDFEKLCAELSFDVKDSGKPVEAVFGGKYSLEEFDVEVPTPEGMEFKAYSVKWSRVSFNKGFDARLEVGATCGGRCAEDQLIANIENEAKKDFEAMGRMGDVTWVKELTEVEPGIRVYRIRRTVDGNIDNELVRVVATRKGAEHYLYCRADLGKDSVGLADSMEKYCLERAAAAVK